VWAWPVDFILELTGANILFPCPCILAGKVLACMLRISSLKALAGLHKCPQLVLGCMSHNLAADTPEVLAVSLSTLSHVMLLAICATCGLMGALGCGVLSGN